MEHIERLKTILLSGSVATLLGRSEEEAGEPISNAQMQRLTTQGWALVHMYTAMDRIEAAVNSGTQRAPDGGVVLAAAAAAATEFGLHENTVRGWQLEYASNDFKFSPDERGKWARELLIHEEDLQRKFHKWMVKTAKDEQLSVEAALEYLNGTLLRPPHTTPQMLADYHITLPISNKTAWRWMRASGAQAGKFKQSYYNDHHEAEFVKKDRADRYIPEMDRDELRQPLWVQISQREYNALLAATKEEGSTSKLPEGFRYQTELGEPMVELHVDDSNHFDTYRAASNLGGNFSIRWAHRPRNPSAPPPNLPHPAADTLASAAAEAAATATAADDDGAATDGATVGAAAAMPPTLTLTFINQSNKPELEAACKARGLPLGTKAVMQGHLRLHLATAAANVEADADEENATEEHVIESVIGRRVCDGKLEYQVTWEGYEDVTWEPEVNLDGCDAVLAAFYSNPETRCTDCGDGTECVYGHHKDVCRCHLPILHVGQDECIFKAFIYAALQWSIKGVSSIRKKTEGPGEMVSAFQDEMRGFGFPMTADELARVNEFRKVRGRATLDSSPGVRFLNYGKNKEGYWDYDMFAKQVVDLMDCIEVLHPDWQLMLEVDWSSGHAKHLDGALNANTMNAKYGGGQKTPRSSTIPTDPEKAALFLGPYDPKLKPGDTQYFYFREGDAPPFYKPNAPKHDTVLCLPSPPSPTPL